MEEIEQAAGKLGPKEIVRLVAGVSAHNHKVWARQMERDATTGTLDFLFE